MKFLGFALILEWVSRVIAHGGVYTYNISGTLYQGNPWHIWDYGPFYGDGNSGIPAGISSIQRRWYFWPLYNINSANMTCNFDGAATSNSLHAAVAAGAIWFKIVQYGLTPEAMNLRGPWLQASMLTGENATGFSVTIPRNLRPGKHLIRHEVVNLQSNKNGGAQFYVECAQLKVGGNGPTAYVHLFPNLPTELQIKIWRICKHTAGLYLDIKKMIQSLAVKISLEEDLEKSAVNITLSHLSNLREIIFVVRHEDRAPEAMFAKHVRFPDPEAIAPFLWQRWKGWLERMDLFKGCIVRVVEAQIV
ncbi:uncharacterized protein PAC_19742 [Phialocephala subalpina]|uniref:lytic cellulose monooxygenase (C4-dehydrogenating) n=1 Tax=Phialocephala subalpina TaxID=576137 RepID=A0A1L7XXN9_9HELO|nr:uncharacterized protein PAC_19742 [Phialocephala subalpina]